MPEKDSSQPEARLSRLVIAQDLCVLASVGGILILALSGATPATLIQAAVEGIAFALLFGGAAAAPALGIAAMIVISRSNGRLRGLRSATANTIAISTVLALVLGPTVFIARTVTMPFQMLCATNLKGIGVALDTYAKDHDDQLPDPERWCDLLVTRADISPASFCCKASDAVKGESSYAMNIAVAGMKLTDIPKDMVVLFEVLGDPNEKTRDFSVTSREFAQDADFAGLAHNPGPKVFRSRWNQVCGPERLDIISHEGGCNVLCGDMHVEFANTGRLAELRWSLDDDFRFPPLITQKPILPRGLGHAALAALVGFAILGMVYLAYRYRGKASGDLSVAMMAGAAMAGGFLGLVSQSMYEIPGAIPGALTGAVVGLVAGLVYANFTVATSRRIIRESDVRGYATAVGMIAGAICSTIVHCVLIVVSQDSQGGYILVGMPYGILAGAILGAIAGAIVRDEAPYPDTPEESS